MFVFFSQVHFLSACSPFVPELNPARYSLFSNKNNVELCFSIVFAVGFFYLCPWIVLTIRKDVCFYQACYFSCWKIAGRISDKFLPFIRHGGLMFRPGGGRSGHLFILFVGFHPLFPDYMLVKRT